MNLPGVKCERWLVPYGDAPLFLQDVALCFCGAAPPCPVLKPLSLITSHFLPHLFKFPKVTVTKALPPLILLGILNSMIKFLAVMLSQLCCACDCQFHFSPVLH